ncbi:unnamed protein product [Paramecium primaurelia]|uniref:Uncharacterized protein n=1 Tax=Paramecium primaurelia TaxID=5886 RepID=A0A8S1NFS8_PARPR|nr:unnamed protein product [Paramecium primaurelia]
MTTDQLSSNKKTWAELAEEEDDEIENGQFTTNSETLDKNDIPYQPSLTKSISEFQTKPRNEKQKNSKQKDNGSNGLKDYKHNNSNQVKGNNKQNRQSKSNYDEVYNALFETTNQEIILKVKSQNKNENLEAVKEYFEKQYQNIKAFPRNDINQVDLLTSPKIGLYILEDLRFKIQIGDSNFKIYYPQIPNEQISEYYTKKRYLEKEKKNLQSAPLFQRSTINSKVNDQQDNYEQSDGSSRQDNSNFEKSQNDQPQIYKEKDYLQDQEQEQNESQYRSKYDKKDFNKQTNYKSRKYNNKYNEQYDYEQGFKEYKDEKQSNYKSHKFRNEQHQPKESYQNQDYEYTEKVTFDKNQSPFEEKDQNKDYRNNQYDYKNNNNNNNHFNSKRSYQTNNKQKNDQYVIYEEKSKQNYYETPNNSIRIQDNLQNVVQNTENKNQITQQITLNEEKNDDMQIDSENEQDQEQIEENKSPSKNKKKKKNKKNLKTSKPNDTNFFGILQSGTK